MDSSGMDSITELLRRFSEVRVSTSVVAASTLLDGRLLYQQELEVSKKKGP